MRTSALALAAALRAGRTSTGQGSPHSDSRGEPAPPCLVGGLEVDASAEAALELAMPTFDLAVPSVVPNVLRDVTQGDVAGGHVQRRAVLGFGAVIEGALVHAGVEESGRGWRARRGHGTSRTSTRIPRDPQPAGDCLADGARGAPGETGTLKGPNAWGSGGYGADGTAGREAVERGKADERTRDGRADRGQRPRGGTPGTRRGHSLGPASSADGDVRRDRARRTPPRRCAR